MRVGFRHTYIISGQVISRGTDGTFVMMGTEDSNWLTRSLDRLWPNLYSGNGQRKTIMKCRRASRVLNEMKCAINGRPQWFKGALVDR